jgi:hypothetical protein
MAKTKHNKAIARTIVGLGTLCAGAVIWASVSGQSAAISTIDKTSLSDPSSAINSAAILDNNNGPAAVVQSNSVSTTNLPVSGASAATNAVATQLTPATVNPGIAVTTTTVPAITQAPVVTNQPIAAPAPRIRTRAS